MTAQTVGFEKTLGVVESIGRTQQEYGDSKRKGEYSDQHVVRLMILSPIMQGVARSLAVAFVLGTSAFAGDLAGIWMGPVAGPKGEKQDIAFQFKANNGSLTGVMFGDEFDLPVKDLAVSGDSVSFSVTSINFYDGRQVTFLFNGKVTENVLELTRERSGGGPNASNRQPSKQILKLKKIG